jgi:hypothetical protein
VLVVVEVVIVGTREELERCGSIASGWGWFMKCDRRDDRERGSSSPRR